MLEEFNKTYNLRTFVQGSPLSNRRWFSWRSSLLSRMTAGKSGLLPFPVAKNVLLRADNCSSTENKVKANYKNHSILARRKSCKNKVQLTSQGLIIIYQYNSLFASKTIEGYKMFLKSIKILIDSNPNLD